MKTLVRLTITLAMFVIVVGCHPTPRQSVATAEASYELTARAFSASIRRGVKYDKPTLNALDFANDEANEALKDANVRVQRDVPLGIDYAMSRVNAAVAYFAKLYASTGAK